MPKPLVQLTDLKVRLGQTTILKEINFSVLPGKVITIVGPNGAGKSTLLRVILGLIKPTSGTVEVRDNLTIGYMPQKLHLDPSLPLTVDYFLGMTRHKRKLSIEGALKSVGAEKLQYSSMHNLSGGELQRVLLAKALICKPDLLILDEPVQGVDVLGQKALYGLIAALHKRWKCAILLVSHDMHIVFSSSDQVVCLNSHICCTGKPETIVNEPEYIKLFGDRLFAPYQHHHDHVHDTMLNHKSKKKDDTHG